MTSLEAFCSADPNTLMTAPPVAELDVKRTHGLFCSINMTVLVTELTQWAGADKIIAVMVSLISNISVD